MESVVKQRGEAGGRDIDMHREGQGGGLAAPIPSKMQCGALDVCCAQRLQILDKEGGHRQYS